jgi:hypothetical protein
VGFFRDISLIGHPGRMFEQQHPHEWTRISDVPSNPPERTERVERLVDRVVEDHREALEKLADE